MTPFRVLLTLWLFLAATFSIASGDNTPVLTGTVNIVLANANGIVVLTDSNQTSKHQSGEPFTSPFPGQKLFRLDDKTVCTIAGFASAQLKGFPEFNSSAAGVVDSYAEELRNKGGTHSFREKLTSLEFLFDMQLSGIGNLQHIDQAQVGDYGFELILVGYDTDGTAKIGKIVLSTNLSPNGIFLPVLKQMTEITVGRELVYEKAGIGSFAVKNILDYPAQFSEEPEIERYARARATNHGSSLTIAEMEALAKSLAVHSAIVNQQYVGSFGGKWWPAKTWSPVGGRNQIALLEEGKVQAIKQQTFEPRRVNTIPFSVVVGMTFDTNGTGALASYVPPGALLLFVKGGFVGDVALDNGYYFEDSFRDGTLYYNGGLLGFDPSNRVTNCSLALGPGVHKDSADVKDLISRFHWHQVSDSSQR